MRSIAAVIATIISASMALSWGSAEAIPAIRTGPGYYSNANAAKLVAQFKASNGPQAWPALVRISRLPPSDLALLIKRLDKDQLSAPASTELKWAINHIRQRALSKPRIQRREAWAVGTFIGAYKSIGDHNPKWDGAAETAIRLYAVRTALWHGHGFNPDAAYRMELECRKAIKRGCRDPLLMFMRDWQWQQTDGAASLAMRADRTQLALERLLTSRYPPDVKFAALFSQCYAIAYKTIIRFSQSSDPFLTMPMQVNMDEILKTLPLVVDNSRTPAIFFSSRVMTLRTWMHTFLGYPWGLVNAKLTAAFAHSAACRKYFTPVLEARMWRDIGWDARGSGYASTVTTRNERIFASDQQKAQSLLRQAAKVNPTHILEWESLVNIGVGAQVPIQDEMNRFLRAMRVDPTYFPTARDMAWYLWRRWYGTPKSETDFASFLIFHGYWRSGIPQFGFDYLIHAVTDNNPLTADYYSNALTRSVLDHSQWHDPQIWGLVKLYFDQYFKHHPGDIWGCADYLHAAELLHHWHTMLREALAAKAALKRIPVHFECGESRDIVSWQLWHGPPSRIDSLADVARRRLGLPVLPVIVHRATLIPEAIDGIPIFHHRPLASPSQIRKLINHLSETAGNPQQIPAEAALFNLSSEYLPVLTKLAGKTSLTGPASVMLDRAIAHLRNRRMSRATLAAQREWYLKATVGAYAARNSAHLAWNSEAFAVLGVFARQLEWTDTCLDDYRLMRVRRAVNALLHAGCRDPLIRFIQVFENYGNHYGERPLDQWFIHVKNITELQRAFLAVLNSGYPAQTKYVVAKAAANLLGDTLITALLYHCNIQLLQSSHYIVPFQTDAKAMLQNAMSFLGNHAAPVTSLNSDIDTIDRLSASLSPDTSADNYEKLRSYLTESGAAGRAIMLSLLGDQWLMPAVRSLADVPTSTDLSQVRKFTAIDQLAIDAFRMAQFYPVDTFAQSRLFCATLYLQTTKPGKLWDDFRLTMHSDPVRLRPVQALAHNLKRIQSHGGGFTKQFITYCFLHGYWDSGIASEGFKRMLIVLGPERPWVANARAELPAQSQWHTTWAWNAFRTFMRERLAHYPNDLIYRARLIKAAVNLGHRRLAMTQSRELLRALADWPIKSVSGDCQKTELARTVLKTKADVLAILQN